MTERPNADQLLAQLKDEGRPRLRIYIGAAPGVGKTYAMLEEAHALRANGVDVVVGFVETYGRADTEAQVRDLEIVPRRNRRTGASCSKRWTSTRSSHASPQMCVVDELAHTNVPGSRHEKRYQDVLELLDAASAC